jgi:HEAT repeat protein
LINLLSDKTIFIKDQAMMSLGQLNDTRAVEPLIKVLLDVDEYSGCRSKAAESLAMLGDVRAIGPLIQAGLPLLYPDISLFS